MWKFTVFLLTFKYVQCFSDPNVKVLNNNTINELNNLYENWLKLFASIPDAVWIIGDSNPLFKYQRQQIPIELDLPADSHVNTGDKFNYTKMIELTGNKNTTDKCYSDLIYLIFNMEEIWAIQMLDAAGKFPSGLLRGNLFWMGEFSECRNVTVPVQVIQNRNFGNFNGEYCYITSWSIGQIPQVGLPLNLGICVPDSCTEETLLKNRKELGMFLSYIPVVKLILSFANYTQLACQNSAKKWETGDISYMCILGIFAVFMVIGTLWDLIKTLKINKIYKTDKKNSVINSEAEGETSNMSDTNSETGLINKEVSCDTEVASSKKENSDSGIAEFFICFSVYTNGAKICNTTNSSNQLNCIHGIRFLSMSWVILGHTFLSFIAVSENIIDILEYGKSFWFQLIAQGTFSVDTFFLLRTIQAVAVALVKLKNREIVFPTESELPLVMQKFSNLSKDNFPGIIGAMIAHIFLFCVLTAVMDKYSTTESHFIQLIANGLLLSYLFLKRSKEENKNVNWIYYYLHRIWRLTPALAMVLGFYATIWIRLGAGPLWPKETDNDNCKQYWWRNLLYIQNFKTQSEMCMAWTWYLANDMQFYIISPLFLILLWKYTAVGIIVVYITLGISFIVTIILSFQTENIFIYLSSTSSTVQPSSLNQTANYFDILYDKPWCRIGPYLIGIFTGYALYRVKDWKKFFNKIYLNVACWIMAIFFGTSVIFGVYHSHMGKNLAAVYNGFSRTTWGIAVAWIIFACVAGFGGMINRILCWNMWIPLSRLTYAAYLIHPVIIGGYFSSLYKQLHFKMSIVIMTYFGVLLASYLAAFVVSVAFESPLMALEKFVLGRFSKKKKSENS